MNEKERITLKLHQAQAGDAYRQTQQAFDLLTDIYTFLVRLDNILHKATWIHTKATELMTRIENFLPDLKKR